MNVVNLTNSVVNISLYLCQSLLHNTIVRYRFAPDFAFESLFCLLDYTLSCDIVYNII